MDIAVNIDITGSQVGSNDNRIESMNLRDLLRIAQDDESLALPDQTLSSCSNFDKRGGESFDRVQSSRTLRDIIQSSRTLRDIIREDSKKSWKSLKDRLIRRHDSGSNVVQSVPASDDVPIHRDNSFRSITQWDSTRITTQELDRSDHPNSESTTTERPTVETAGLREEPGGQAENNEASANGSGREEPPARMSLMALLAETDKPPCINGPSYAVDEVDEEEDMKVHNNCCVCMLRHKGSAFIPCGHTFCRLCSRELWAQRGICPLCNNVIMEILDIF